jgi:hypothetical protein
VDFSQERDRLEPSTVDTRREEKGKERNIEKKGAEWQHQAGNSSSRRNYRSKRHIMRVSNSYGRRSGRSQ